MKNNANKTPEYKEVISCNCNIVTWNPGWIKHQSKCSIFRKLNTGLTFKEFMKSEGFNAKDGEELPSIDLNEARPRK